MIKDKIKNAYLYYNLHPKFKEAFEKILNNNLERDEDKLYFNLDKYETKKEGKFEAHRKYIDIQYIVKGEEKIGLSNIDDCQTLIEYNKEKDIEFLTSKKEDYMSLSEGEFMIFYPTDAHKPCLTNTKVMAIEKIVAKVLV